MVRFDPRSNTKIVQAIHPVAKTATFTENVVVDCLGFRFARIIALMGAVSGTTPNLDLQVSMGALANGSDAVAVTGALMDDLAAADANTRLVGLVDLKKNGNRYLSLDGTVTGTTPSFLIGVVVELSDQLDSVLFTQDTYEFNV